MDERAWDNLYQTHRSRVYGLCLRILGDSREAEDACGEAFLRAHQARKDYDSSRPFTPWILTIASRISIDHLRRRELEYRLFGSFDEEPPGWEPVSVLDGPLQAVLERERATSLRAAMARLGTRDRAVLTLKYYAELGYDEIGDILGLSRRPTIRGLRRKRTQDLEAGVDVAGRVIC